MLFGLRSEVASTMRIFSLDRLLAITDTREAAIEKATQQSGEKLQLPLFRPQIVTAWNMAHFA